MLSFICITDVPGLNTHTHAKILSLHTIMCHVPLLLVCLFLNLQVPFRKPGADSAEQTDTRATAHVNFLVFYSFKVSKGMNTKLKDH